MRFLPVANPPNPFASTTLDYDLGEEPGAPLQVFEDHTRSILAKNDSPDVGFRWSVNPYRGCFHSCAYCLRGDTRITMRDGSSRTIEQLRVGDAVLGTREDDDGVRRTVATEVLAHWPTVKRAYRISLEDGSEIVASGDHRFLSTFGWRYVVGLTSSDALLAPVEARGGAKLEPKRITQVRDLGEDVPMFDITTGTEDFLANGVVSHNCYARPSHEYLSFGAGTDFERKIVVKPRAAELLREAFDRKAWQGELVVFSGITDCYQPLEASMKLTRRCLEVCIDYRNPAGFITKSPVIERDAELLAELARVASCKVSVSIPFWDPEVAKAMEPFVTTPARRMKIVETLAKAGVPVGVSVSPIVPGLNDNSVPDVLKAASDAGARHAFFVMLRLPGSVKPVFEAALREKLPLRAEKVLRRLREMHGGKVYNAQFGVRGRGEGNYAEAIQVLFTQTAKRFGLVSDEMESYAAPATFRRPGPPGQTSFGF